jgi:uncharacterized protein YecE (DUF72 family)
MTRRSRTAPILIGTSGWSYDHWKGPFYPQDLPSRRMLEHYAATFSSVEINNSFYRLPERRTLRGWAATVPEGFVFAIKASRYITHMKKLKDPKSSCRRFFERIGALGAKLGPIVFQLPPHWSFNEDRLGEFLSALHPDYRYAFEFRDRSWLNEHAYRLLADHGASLCIYDYEGFTSPKRSTTDFVYLRLHGPNVDAYRGRYSQPALRRWAADIRRWVGQGKSVYCYFDNDEAGYAATDARCLQRLVEGSSDGRE